MSTAVLFSISHKTGVRCQNMAQQNETYSYNRFPLNNRKEWASKIQDSIDQPEKIICGVKEAWYKSAHTVWFHSCEILELAELI